MLQENEIRPLTRQEQLEYYIPFLRGQIRALEQELLIAEQELLEIYQNQLEMGKNEQKR